MEEYGVNNKFYKFHPEGRVIDRMIFHSTYL